MEDHEIRRHLEIFISSINMDRNPYTAPANHRRIPNNIRHRWDLWGQPVEMHEISHYTEKGYNLWIPPKDLTKPCILLLAHHDTVPNCPGLDDNGSGMAILDFLAFYFAYYDTSSNIAFAMVDWEESDPRLWKYFEKWAESYEFTWSDMTEIDRETHFKFRNYLHKHVPDVGSFLGTRKLIEFLQQKEITIEVVLNFETVGLTSNTQKTPKFIPIELEKGDFLALIGTNISQPWMKQLLQTANPGFYLPLVAPMNGKTMPDTRRSDHSVFWDNQIPAIMFTDTANYRNSNYHMESDVNLDFDFMVELCKSMINFLSNIDKNGLEL